MKKSIYCVIISKKGGLRMSTLDWIDEYVELGIFTPADDSEKKTDESNKKTNKLSDK